MAFINSTIGLIASSSTDCASKALRADPLIIGISSPGKLYFLWFIFWIFIVSYAHFYLIKYYLKQKREDKKHLRLLLFAISFGFISGTINFLFFLKTSLYQFANLGIIIYCLIVTYAIFKHQLLGVEIIYRKSLLYSLLITILSGVYLLLIMIIEWLFRGIIGYKSLVVSLSSAFIIALIFNPLHDKIQTLIDTIFLGRTPQEIAKENELLKQELGRSERLKTASSLALGLCHEIKNPLTTIKTFSEFLPERLKDEQFLSKFSQLIPLEVERINNIVHQLLDFAKPSPPSFKDTNIHDLIKNTLEFLNSEFLRRRFSASESYENSQLIIKIDPVQIRQVLLNLFFNATEAMPNGGRINIKTRNLNDEFLEIEIGDTGCGIAKKDLDHIFEPFFTTKDEGTGLGLSITHQIIKIHQGTIEVESEIGEGTTFRIKLPLEKKTPEIKRIDYGG